MDRSLEFKNRTVFCNNLKKGRIAETENYEVRREAYTVI